MSEWSGILWLFVLLLANAFFVAAEFAVISARRSQIEPRAEAGEKRAKTALYAMEHATLMLATSQLGITVCSLVILNVSEPAIHHLLEGPLEWTGMSANMVSIIGFIITLVLVTYLHVVVGEMIPKNAAFSVPDRAVLILAPPLVAVSRVFGLLIKGLNAIANGILRLFGVEPKSETNSSYTLEEVATIVSHSQEEGLLEDRSGALTAAFDFTQKNAERVAVSRDALVTISHLSSPDEVEQTVAKHGFSRYIVTDEHDSLVGYVHIKDLIRIAPERASDPIPAKRIRQLLDVPADAVVGDVVALMQQEGTHLARVTAAEGEEVGVLFLEDVIEELVGEVHDATRRKRFD
ncbi:HlyC/CorC family transporter [Leucobacter sp. UCMA 4100]|uniref:hemolysin family protein n=1 Tax=Leucobacter sp. UCMA 4100 TaxID=2810534 RepID=UPI0022EB87BA|nr:hemolysin family protein [Leucobacter sp. UCMA 4100]MDA3146141.1 HlyC/CorC family transporter [Leucobacter sp. UCMA 4100]